MLLSLLLAAATANSQTHIAAIKGEVTIRHSDAGQQVAATNTPLQPDDRIATGPNSRADIQFDSTSTFQLGSNAEIRLMQSPPGQYQTELLKGEINLSSPNIAVDTPSVSVRPANQGVYRIAVNPAGESEITVRAGEVEVFAPSGSQRVTTGQKMLARGSPSDPEFKIVSAIPKWRRVARIFSSVQLGATAPSASSDDKRDAKTAPKPASKTTPTTASNGGSKATPPTRGNFQPAPSTNAASHTESHSASNSSHGK